VFTEVQAMMTADMRMIIVLKTFQMRSMRVPELNGVGVTELSVVFSTQDLYKITAWLATFNSTLINTLLSHEEKMATI
jgi:hypothetical protein